MNIFLRLVVVGFFTIPTWALAQDYSPGDSYFDFGSAYISAGMGMAGIQSTMQSAEAQVAARTPAVDPPKSVKFTFAPSLQSRRTNLAKFVERTRATDPVGADKMQTMFASTDIIAMIDQQMQQAYGMRANDVADSYAVWWVSAWMGAHGRSDDASPTQMTMVRRQAANALAESPQFASATDAAKQELAEALLIQAALIGATIDTYKDDPAMLAKARAAIAKGASSMGLDLSAMTLTGRGFVPVGRR
jgi:hypothetical protein